jgi:hypothetical protein
MAQDIQALRIRLALRSVNDPVKWWAAASLIRFNGSSRIQGT